MKLSLLYKYYKDNNILLDNPKYFTLYHGDFYDYKGEGNLNKLDSNEYKDCFSKKFEDFSNQNRFSMNYFQFNEFPYLFISMRENYYVDDDAFYEAMLYYCKELNTTSRFNENDMIYLSSVVFCNMNEVHYSLLEELMNVLRGYNHLVKSLNESEGQ